jgi:hypothetical protein
MTDRLDNVRSVADQAAGFGDLGEPTQRQAAFGRKFRDSPGGKDEHRLFEDQDRVGIGAEELSRLPPG